MSVASCQNQVAHHCPVTDCVYAPGSKRYFTTKRLLNQHIEKVHAEKKYACSKCQKGFGTNWLRKNHEISCGKSWNCSCGHKYASRESLLSHVRRKDHDLTEEVRLTPKKILLKNMKKKVIQPVVFVIQPIIQQQISLVLPSFSAGTDKRLILPKQLDSPIANLVPVASFGSVVQALNNEGPDTFNVPGNSVTSNLGTQQQNSYYETVGTSRSVKCGKDSVRQERKQKSHIQTVAETQTCDELNARKESKNQSTRKLESRGSQCYGQVRKQRVGIESTYTQTMESAVVKMKKRGSGTRSRRKSVAVVTDFDMLEPTHSLWSDFEKFILPPVQEKDAEKLNRNSSTQTTPDPCFETCGKVMCDSQTTTDNDLFPFDWSFEKNNLLDNSAFRMSDHLSSPSEQSMQVPSVSEQVPPINSITGTNGNDLKNFNLWSDEKCSNDVEFAKGTFDKCNIPLLTSILDGCTSASAASEPSDLSVMKGSSMEKYSSDSSTEKMHAELANFDCVLDTVINSANSFQDENSPHLLHTQTQTNTPLEIDYTNILANMETQTTDDFLFSDLEFSDTETQTPWEDIPNFSDGLTADQFSIEIQTDFSTVNTLESQNKQDISLLMPMGKHMETQTLDSYQMPQLTNSEAQTLIPSSYLFV